MRQIGGEIIEDAVAVLCRKANYELPDDIVAGLEAALESEGSEAGRSVLRDLLDNAVLARGNQMAICQDTGMAVVFAEIGQDLHIKDDFFKSVERGVAKGYKEGYLRASVVKDPILRQNTGDNTPPVIHYELIPGDSLHLIVAPKGFGSENMSALRMLKPADGIKGIEEFVLETVKRAGPNPCPPVIIGLGIGGTMEKAALLAKKALLRRIGAGNEIAHIADLENNLLRLINKTGIGPGGLGGKITALGVNIETYATHIAGLPVALNMSCHATRHADIWI